MKHKAEVGMISIALVVVAAVVYLVVGLSTGKLTYKEIYHASSTTDCLIVNSGGRVSVDCWIVEGEHEHEN